MRVDDIMQAQNFLNLRYYDSYFRVSFQTASHALHKMRAIATDGVA